MQKQQEAPETLRAVTEASIQHKDNYFCEYVKARNAVLSFFSQNTSTMLDCERATGIRRDAWICRLIPELEIRNLLFRVKRDLCPVSKHKAWFFTTNPQGNE